jgi:hypothetical protein
VGERGLIQKECFEDCITGLGKIAEPVQAVGMAGRVRQCCLEVAQRGVAIVSAQRQHPQPVVTLNRIGARGQFLEQRGAFGETAGTVERGGTSEHGLVVG